MTGLLVVGLGLLGVAGFTWLSGGDVDALIGLGLVVADFGVCSGGWRYLYQSR